MKSRPCVTLRFATVSITSEPSSVSHLPNFMTTSFQLYDAYISWTFDEVVGRVAGRVEAVAAEDAAVVAEHQVDLEAGVSRSRRDPPDLDLRRVEIERVVVEVELVDRLRVDRIVRIVVVVDEGRRDVAADVDAC